jgi:hypothetical protein
MSNRVDLPERQVTLATKRDFAEALPVRIDLALRAPRLGSLHQDADQSIPLAGRK